METAPRHVFHERTACQKLTGEQTDELPESGQFRLAHADRDESMGGRDRAEAKLRHLEARLPETDVLRPGSWKWRNPGSAGLEQYSSCPSPRG